jgi:hypothetical protein
VIALIIVAVVIVLMLIALPFAKRRDIRKGHSPRSMGDIRSTIRAQRMELRSRRGPGRRS